MRLISLLSALLLTTLVACKAEESKKETKTETPAAETAKTGEAADKADQPEEYFVVGTSSVRKIASKERKIEDPEGKSKKPVSNYVTLLHRGETVMVLEQKTDDKGDPWAKVETSDEQEGWMELRSLINAGEVKVATVLEDAKIFRRPDLTTLKADTAVPAGSVLFVLRDKEQFSEVNYPRSFYSGSDIWIQSSALSTDSGEISAARMVSKIRYLRDKKDAAAEELTKLAKETFAESKLIALLDAPAEEGAAGEEGEATEKVGVGEATAEANDAE